MGCTGNEPDTSTPTPTHNHTDGSTPATSKVIDCKSVIKEIALKLSNGVVANITVEVGQQHTSINSFWLYDVRWSLKNEGDEEVKVDRIAVNLGEADFNRSINTTLEPSETNKPGRNHLIYPPHRILLEKKVSPRIEGRIELACEDQRLEKNFVIQPPIARFGDKLKIGDNQLVTFTGWNRSNSISWSCEDKNYSYEADSGMDFIALSYEVRNEDKEELKPPSFSWIELATEKGEIYETCVPSDLLQNEKEGLDGSALKCLTGTNNELMPGEVVKASQVFEIPQNENPDFIKISSCLLEI
ncbi:MAG: hypothetical protein R6U44_03160 [Archaeoglobaceae archaeon]